MKVVTNEEKPVRSWFERIIEEELAYANFQRLFAREDELRRAELRWAICKCIFRRTHA